MKRIFVFFPLLIGLTSDGADVRRFGARGDGKTDDTAAFQRAVDSKAGDIRIPKGIYRLTKTVVISLDAVGPTSVVGSGTSKIVMEGPGPAFKFVGTHRGTADPKTVESRVWERQRTPVIDGIEIVGVHAKSEGIEASGTMQLTISRVVVRKTLHGIHLTVRNRNVIISDCHLYENRGAGIYLDDVNLHQINISNCHVSYNAAGGIVARAGNVRNIQITGCDIEGNMPPEPGGASPAANVLIDGRGGTHAVAEVAITGCTIQHTQASPDSANIRFIGPEKRPERWGNITISANVMSDVCFNIDLLRARGVTITGNVMWKGRKRDIRIAESCDVLLGPNVLDRNPRYWGQKDTVGGVLFSNCTDCTISGLHIVGVRKAQAGLILERSKWCNVTGSTILDCENAGILLKECEECRISGCMIRKPQAAKKKWVEIRTE